MMSAEIFELVVCATTYLPASTLAVRVVLFAIAG
jgi:hypothetical protein